MISLSCIDFGHDAQFGMSNRRSPFPNSQLRKQDRGDHPLPCLFSGHDARFNLKTITIESFCS